MGKIYKKSYKIKIFLYKKVRAAFASLQCSKLQETGTHPADSSDWKDRYKWDLRGQDCVLAGIRKQQLLQNAPHRFPQLNQAEPKQVYLCGQANKRQISVRVYEPFDWRPVNELKRKYEKPLEVLNQVSLAPGQKQRIVLEFMRDEEAIKYDY